MRGIISANFLTALVLLAGCAASPDPAKGGFFDGVYNLTTGGYERRIDEQTSDLQSVRERRNAAEAEAAETKAALAERERLIAKLREDVAELDRTLKHVEAKAAQKRKNSAVLTQQERELMRDLDSSKARLTSLEKQLAASKAAQADYYAVKEEYESLEAAIAVLTQQLSEN
jgi:chromosome segregation ATPase